MEEQIIPESELNKRPTFIKVLCILTWIGCALAILGGIAGYFFTRMGCENIDAFQGASGPFGTYTKADMEFNCENLIVTTYVNVLCGIVCLVGSIMMWNLKKLGFYIYVMGEIIPPVTIIILTIGTGLSLRGGFIGLGFSAVWIFLYALNLKHMKN